MTVNREVLQHAIKLHAEFHCGRPGLSDKDFEESILTLFGEKYTPTIGKELFYRLVDALGQPKTVKYTPQRAIKLRQRRKTFSEADLIKAAKIVAGDPFLQGDNPGGKRYGNIDYLLRNDEKVDNWLAEGGNSTGTRNLNELEF